MNAAWSCSGAVLDHAKVGFGEDLGKEVGKLGWEEDRDRGGERATGGAVAASGVAAVHILIM